MKKQHSQFMLVATAIALCCGLANAQYLGLNLRGDTGLKAGTQPDPGIYIALPLYYRNGYDGIRGPNGGQLLSNLHLDINLFAVPALTVVTKQRFLGANYGFQVVPIILNQRLGIADVDFDFGHGGYGFGDLYVQPVNLGWHTERADVLAGYGFFGPTGRKGRTLDMWAHEITGGGTVYLDSAKRWNLSSAVYYDINQTKRDSDIKVGQILTLEGGVARSFLQGAANVGGAYVAQWKITRDSGSDIPAGLPLTKGRVFGAGPEISVPVFVRGRSLGIVAFRYIFEFGARTNFEGQTLAASFTFARLAPKSK